ncbi:tonB-dependent siderophore receptor family protein [Bordetella holmesii 30539]|uniref:TonB-dependent siderophore receptor family protein n=1 Tax=Bordetella holmesii 1058 TaxID=1247648 RepID=A0ABN0S1E6_9BORD|nr:tonB-dependent siderophore receptor family protein [Bordetella holmesii 41130]EWM46042.1 tonB-dependent siderophore receptor family protein [Bordetella holmesii 35009]EXF89106.1 tonB-dependent siderophore receptor family protein [Bordetella holmesii 30539]EXX95311.1 tonB-dependent siderophore receptor family protein [Bordetella holmesii 1058]KAK81705.1 TonB-dependent siderophore receptor [Bordetella holmesii H620]
MAAVLPWGVLHAQSAPATSDNSVTLGSIKVEASADASAAGLAPAFDGGQVATGSRAGILGTRDNLETPFSMTSYTSELIKDRQARSVADVLQNDPGVRVARGFGNFQESYFVRGFLLSSEDIAYNGLYGLMPRQYIASEFFERVEVLRGASNFLTGTPPTGGGVGGAINLVPKRAPNEPLTEFTTGISSGGAAQFSADIARRFGPDDSTGIRINVGQRGGESEVDGEFGRTTAALVGLDWHNDRARISADIGYQYNRIKRGRPNVSLAGTATSVPDAPHSSTNYAQDWSYSNERDVFGTLRGEYDLTDTLTAYAAYGHRDSKEINSLANVNNVDSSGNGNFYRFDNVRKDKVDTGEIGLRAKLDTGPVKHEAVLAASYFELEKKNAYAMDYANTTATNIYSPVHSPKPAFSAATLFGNDLGDPALNGRVRMTSVALGDTMSVLDDSVLLTLGLRHQRLYSRDFAYNTGVGSKAYDESRNSPAAGIVWRVTPEISLYANYIEALTAGDTAPANSNGLPVTNAGAMLRPYVSKQKEVGVKLQRDGIGAGLAFFSTDKPRSFVNANQQFTESGKDRHQGLELTWYGQVAPSVRVLGGVT